MIEIRSNAAEVAAAFREIQRLTPRVAGQVMTNVGMSLRKDMRMIIQSRKNEHGIRVAKQSPGTRAYKAAKGMTKSLGGDMPKHIFFSKRTDRVMVGMGKRRERYFKLFQAGSGAGRESRKQLYARHEFAATLNPDPAISADIMSDYYRIKSGHEPRHNVPAYRVPARSVMVPLARSPFLARRIRSAATKRLESMANKAARGVRK